MQSSVPKRVYVIPGFPHSFDQVGPTKVVFLVLTDIVVRVSPRTLRSITDLLLPKISPCAKTRNPAEKNSTECCLLLGRTQRQDCYSMDNSEFYWAAWISSVDGINQTNHSTDQKRPCTTIQGIEKEHSICQSSSCPDLVKFPVLGQIKPHAPRLVVPFRQFL